MEQHKLGVLTPVDEADLIDEARASEVSTQSDADHIVGADKIVRTSDQVRAAGLEAQQERLNTGQQKIKGYRDLSPAELALVNRIKAHGEATGALIHDVREHYDAVLATFDTPGAEPSSITAEQEREIIEAIGWLDEAEKQLKIGQMLLVRSVTRPRGF